MNEQSDLHLPPPSFEPGQPMEYQPNNSPERVPNPELFPSSNITSASNVGLAFHPAIDTGCSINNSQADYWRNSSKCQQPRPTQ